MRRKTKYDYVKLARARGIDWVGDEIPPSTLHKTQWRCARGHIWTTRYSKIYEGNSCPHCAGTRRKTISDYIALAELNGVEWIDDRAPSILTKTFWRLPDGVVFEDSYSNMKNKVRRGRPTAQSPELALRRRVDEG